MTNSLGIKISNCHINRLLKQMGLSTRPKQLSIQTTASSQDSQLVIHDLHAS